MPALPSARRALPQPERSARTVEGACDFLLLSSTGRRNPTRVLLGRSGFSAYSKGHPISCRPAEILPPGLTKTRHNVHVGDTEVNHDEAHRRCVVAGSCGTVPCSSSTGASLLWRG